MKVWVNGCLCGFLLICISQPQPATATVYTSRVVEAVLKIVNTIIEKENEMKVLVP